MDIDTHLCKIHTVYLSDAPDRETSEQGMNSTALARAELSHSARTASWRGTSHHGDPVLSTDNLVSERFL